MCVCGSGSGWTWAGWAPAASSVGGGGMGGGEQGALMLPLLPQGTAPVAHTQQHILKEGGPLQADDGSIVGSHAGLAVVWMFLTLHPHTPLYAKAHRRQMRACSAEFQHAHRHACDRFT